jgi:hypothetical protein
VCETTDQFMNVLQFVRATVEEDVLAYAPLWFINELIKVH